MTFHGVGMDFFWNHTLNDPLVPVLVQVVGKVVPFHGVKAISEIITPGWGNGEDMHLGQHLLGT